ncbi:MAG TPA: peptidase MA family metallohydrolase [Anaerolineales bacterium]|nr:peptidase MA family metallohydrolase [Anaerolineales bacterium]
MKLGKSILWALALLAVSFSLAGTGSAQSSSWLSELQAEAEFGVSMTFSAEIETGTDFDSIDLVFKVLSTGKSTVVPAEFDGFSSIQAAYSIRPQDSIAAFSTIEYWFILTLENGTVTQSDTESFIYMDNRYDWQTLGTNGPYEVYWIDGDLAFGQEIEDVLLQSLDQNQLINLPSPDSLRVYVYDTPSRLQSALELTNARWVAGHTNPAENIIMVSIPNSYEKSLAIQRQIPHELTHVRLYMKMGENYANLPAWYDEGLASLSELSTLPEYWDMLQAAWRNNDMIPFSQLCRSFPANEERAGLAYAQADSFIRFLYNEYGEIGLEDLLDAYKQGYSCESGIQEAFDLDLEALEKDWYQETFNSSILPQSLNTALTWVILLLLLFATPLGLILFSSRKRS